MPRYSSSTYRDRFGCQAGILKLQPAICILCGREFFVTNPRLKLRLCSKECRGTWTQGTHERRVEGQRVRRERENMKLQTTCKVCGKTYTRTKGKRSSYCSRECSIKSNLDGCISRYYDKKKKKES
jgi:hypothetical protein